MQVESIEEGRPVEGDHPSDLLPGTTLRIESPKHRRAQTPFIGRRREREHLHAALDRGVGMICLTGPSGIGKTRLARQVAVERFDSMQIGGGIWFCSLAGCTSATDLEFTVARALGIDQQQGDELARSLANRGPTLLVLDNADPIADQLAGVLGSWLQRCVELQMIVTSVAPVEIPGELAIELRSLESDDAVALYLDRASRAWADRDFSQEETIAVQELVRRLDRFPLAIELAAGRVRVLPPKTMLSMFERRFDLLRRSGSSRPPTAHHASLLGALELSWQHLDAAEQRALAQLAIFEGSFTAETAAGVLEEELIAGSSPAERRAHVSLLLADLHQRSLVDREDDPALPRFFLLESVRAFALQELKRMGAWDRMSSRHAGYFLSTWGQIPPYPVAILNRFDKTQQLEREREELLAIHRRFLSSEPSLAARAVIALAPLLSFGGLSPQEAELISSADEAARGGSDPKLLQAALDLSFTALFRLGRFSEAKGKLKEAIALAQETGERAIEAFNLSRLALCHIQSGDLDAVHSPMQRASSISEELDEPSLRGWTLMTEGTLAGISHDHDRAGTCLREATSLLRDHGSSMAELNSLFHLGLSLADQRRHADARRVFHEALEGCRARRVRSLEAHILANLTILELGAGFLDEAEVEGQRGVALLRELGLELREAKLLASLGLIALERGELDLAADRLQLAEELLDASSGEAPPLAKIYLAILEVLRHQPGQARRLLDRVRNELATNEEEPAMLLEGGEAILEVGEAWELLATQKEEAERKVGRARERLGLMQRTKIRLPSQVPAVLRLLERELDAWISGTPSPPPAPSSIVLAVGAAFDWFQPSRGAWVDLRDRKVIQRIFESLARARLESPGVWIDPQTLLRAGWPELNHGPDAPLRRLHSGVWTLRDLGLRAVIQNRSIGYRLDPNVPLLRTSSESASPGE